MKEQYNYIHEDTNIGHLGYALKKYCVFLSQIFYQGTIFSIKCKKFGKSLLFFLILITCSKFIL